MSEGRLHQVSAFRLFSYKLTDTLRFGSDKERHGVFAVFVLVKNKIFFGVCIVFLEIVSLDSVSDLKILLVLRQTASKHYTGMIAPCTLGFEKRQVLAFFVCRQPPSDKTTARPSLKIVWLRVLSVKTAHNGESNDREAGIQSNRGATEKPYE